MLSVVLGAAVAFLSAKVSRGKALGQNLVMAVFFVAVFWFSFQLNGMIGELAAQAGEIKAAMGWARAPAVDGGWSAGELGAAAGLPGLLRRPLWCWWPWCWAGVPPAVTAFQSKAARSDYKLSAQSAAGQRKALLRKEAKRFSAPPSTSGMQGLG